MKYFVGILTIGLLMGIAVAEEKPENVADGGNPDVPLVRNRRWGLDADKPGCTAVLARQDYETVGRLQRECLRKNYIDNGESNSYVSQLMTQCARSDEFNTCLDNALSNNRGCLYKQYIDIARPRTKSYKAALEFFCDRKTGADTCWASKSQAKDRCERSSRSATDSNASQGSAECRRMELFQSCMADELRTCENPKVADVFNELWDATKMATPCSASAIANVLFVTVTTALLSMRLI